MENGGHIFTIFLPCNMSLPYALQLRGQCLHSVAFTLSSRALADPGFVSLKPDLIARC